MGPGKRLKTFGCEYVRLHKCQGNKYSMGAVTACFFNTFYGCKCRYVKASKYKNN